MLILNLALIFLVAYSAEFSHAQTSPENSIFYHLLIKDMDVLIDENTLELNVKGNFSIYLLKNGTSVRTGALVTCEVLLLNEKRTLMEVSKGVYSTELFERLVITAPSIKTFKVIPEKIVVKVNDVEKYSSEVSGAENVSVMDYLSYEGPQLSMTGFIYADVSASEIAREVPVEVHIRAKILSNGTPLANSKIVYSLPDYNFKQEVLTDENGVFEVHISDIVLLKVSNGTVVSLEQPIQLPEETDVIVFWWGGPSPPPPSPKPKLSITVYTDQDKYRPCDWVKVYGKVKDDKGNSVAGATVKITIYRKTWLGWEKIYERQVRSTSDGSYSIDYKLKATAKLGDYKVEVRASKSGYESASASKSFKVIAHPKIKEIDYVKGYLVEYKEKGGNIVFNRGKTFEVVVWLVDHENIDTERYHINVEVLKPNRCRVIPYNKWEDEKRSEWFGLKQYKVKGKRFKVEIPSNSPLGKYELVAKLLYTNNRGEEYDLSSEGLKDARKVSYFYVIFYISVPKGFENYVYNEHSDKDEKVVYFKSYEVRKEHRWMGMEEALARDIKPFSDSIFKTAIETVQGENSEIRAIIKLKDKVRSIVDSKESLDYAVKMVELSRSIGIPARVATIDVNEGMAEQRGVKEKERNNLYIAEVYVDNKWYAIDAYNDVGPMLRSEFGSLEDYSEENNDDIFVAKQDHPFEKKGWW